MILERGRCSRLGMGSPHPNPSPQGRGARIEPSFGLPSPPGRGDGGEGSPLSVEQRRRVDGALANIPVAVFAKPPIPGAVKTRLARRLGEDAAALLARAFPHRGQARAGGQQARAYALGKALGELFGQAAVGAAGKHGCVSG